MRLINGIKTNNMPKVILWFFIYTLLTFAIGILCKVLVAWHVNDMHSDLQKTHDLFATAAAMPGADVKLGAIKGHDLTLGDLFALDYINSHKGDIKAGDGSADRFLIVSQHLHQMSLTTQQNLALATNLLHSHDATAIANALQNMSSMLANFQQDLSTVAGFQADIIKDTAYAQSMTNEANMVFWLQIALIVLTLAAYPVGILKMWKIKHKPEYKYDSKIHKRMIVEYIVFLAFFVGIDTYATYLLIAENVPMTFWNAFSVGSMAIPTGFAIGSLIFLHFNKNSVVDQQNLKFSFLNNWKGNK